MVKDLERRLEEETDISTKCSRAYKYIIPAKKAALATLVLIPYFEVPSWCLTAGWQDDNNCKSDDYFNSNIPKMDYVVLNWMYVLSFLILGTFVVMRIFRKKVNKKSIIRSCFLLALILFGLVDLLLCMINVLQPTGIPRTISVFFLLVFVRQMRTTLGEIARVVWRTMPIFMIIFAIITFYSYMGFVLYSDSPVLGFESLNQAIISVFIMFTLSNYPNISLPYYAKQRSSFFFFASFIILGLYLFQNLLLAAIFNNYKNHL